MSRCTDCGTRSKKRTYHSVKRKGGGNYRRPSRWYDSTICDQCVARHIAYYEECVIPDSLGVGRTTGGTNYSWRGVFKAAGRDDLIQDHSDRLLGRK